MKKLAAKKNGECMACLQCVAACSEAFYKEFDEEKSCVRIVAKGAGAKPNTCIQCGKCMRTCEHEAITQNPKTGVYMINKKKCVSCGKCAEACPMHVIVFEEGSPASKCIACGICVKACPMELLEIVEKYGQPLAAHLSIFKKRLKMKNRLVISAASWYNVP